MPPRPPPPLRFPQNHHTLAGTRLINTRIKIATHTIKLIFASIIRIRRSRVNLERHSRYYWHAMYLSYRNGNKQREKKQTKVTIKRFV